MLDDARNLIGDLASGKIKDQRLALLADELTASDRKLADATAKLSVLEAGNKNLEEHVKQLEATIHHFGLQLKTEVDGRKYVSDEAAKMLELLFDSESRMTINRLAEAMGITVNVAKFHFDSLVAERLVEQAGSEPQWYRVGEKQTFLSTYDLTPGGRKQVMLARENQKD
jgi:predicted transcriptional regulator